ncbi:transposase, partial [Enterococcus avium]
MKREVKKFRDCGDLKKGYRLFVCEGCHDVKKVAFRCKGKFCPTCATGESQRWAEVAANDLFTVTHRHVIFTIDEGLREIFLKEKYRKELLKGLMDEAARILLDFFRKHHIQAGVVAILHTFGSQLEYNPHVHLVVTMGGLTKDGKWKDYDYFPFAMLRKYWQNAVLKLIRRTLSQWDKARVQPLLQAAYTKNAEGFYVHAPKRSRTSLKKILEYISRYMKRGPIALNRILLYDGKIVMFQYHDKRTNTDKIKTMSAEEFIGALIRHIPENQFKTIRRYGIY